MLEVPEHGPVPLFGKREGRSLSDMLGGTRERVQVGVSVGVQPDIDTLLQVVGDYLADGYQRIKLKIKPGWDIEPTRAVREAWPDILLQVTAKGTPAGATTSPSRSTCISV